VGLGATGLSTMRHLHACGLPFSAYDQRRPSDDDAFWGDVAPLVGTDQIGFEDKGLQLLKHAKEIYLSPGIAPDAEWLTDNIQPEVKISGDLDLVSKAVDAPVIAITGSNAKSTVTTLVGEMALASGIQVAFGGNLGTPMLDLIDKDVDLYVLELSSFQLERSDGLRAHTACILNVSDDHLDRHGTMSVYHAHKQRVYRRAKCVVFNRDDPLTQPLSRDGVVEHGFGLGKPLADQFGFDSVDGELVACCGNEVLFECSKINLLGQHNLLNALAAYAIGRIAGFDSDAMRSVLYRFKGLPHRCELVDEIEGIRFVNDSKATNVGAAVAAINGLSSTLSGGAVHLIAGGVAKGASFEPLLDCCLTHGVRLVLIGEAADQIEKLLSIEASRASYSGAGNAVEKAASMEAAIAVAYESAASGDVVLLAPACASFDMFESYQHRGNAFKAAVDAIVNAIGGGRVE